LGARFGGGEAALAKGGKVFCCSGGSPTRKKGGGVLSIFVGKKKILLRGGSLCLLEGGKEFGAHAKKVFWKCGDLETKKETHHFFPVWTIQGGGHPKSLFGGGKERSVPLLGQSQKERTWPKLEKVWRRTKRERERTGDEGGKTSFGSLKKNLLEPEKAGGRRGGEEKGGL